MIVADGAVDPNIVICYLIDAKVDRHFNRGMAWQIDLGWRIPP